MAQDLSKYEYTVKNYAFTAIAASGARFKFSNRMSEAAPDHGESSSVGQGSGPNPVYHLEKTKEPKCSITVPVNEQTKFFRWFELNCTNRVCNLEVRRSKPGEAVVVDLITDWLPVRGAQTVGTDANMVPISGNAFEIREDITNVLQP